MVFLVLLRNLKVIGKTKFAKSKANKFAKPWGGLTRKGEKNLYASNFNETIIRGRGSLWTSIQQMEPKNEEVYLHNQK